jgi:hypothetical protein
MPRAGQGAGRDALRPPLLLALPLQVRAPPARPAPAPRPARSRRLRAPRRWMEVQNYCRACPVCKAGVETDKVRGRCARRTHRAAPTPRAALTARRPPRRSSPSTAGAATSSRGTRKRSRCSRCRPGPRASGPQRCRCALSSPVPRRGSRPPPLAPLTRNRPACAGQRGPHQPAGRPPRHLRLPARARCAISLPHVAVRAPPRARWGLTPLPPSIRRAGIRGGAHTRAAAPGGRAICPALQARPARPRPGACAAAARSQQSSDPRASLDPRASHAAPRASHAPPPPPPPAQAFLSRLLLMLGSFVIMCLLLF